MLATQEIYIGNLPFKITEEEVRQLCAPFGAVKKVAMINDRESGRFRGFCFVEMDEAAAKAAIGGLEGKEVGGRQIRVNKARPRKQQSGSRRKGKAGGEKPLHERTQRGGSGSERFPHSGGSRGQRSGRGQRGNAGDSDFPFSGGGSRRDL